MVDNLFDPEFVYNNFGGGVIKQSDTFLGGDGITYVNEDHDCKGEKCTNRIHEELC